MFEPKATAPHLDSTTSRNTHGQQITSALPPKGEVNEACQIRREGQKPTLQTDNLHD
jgi:hypothetical protein